MSRFKPSRGGHAPGDLRDAFFELLDRFEDWEEGDPAPTIELRGNTLTAAALCGLLWNCTDILPYGHRELLSDAGFEGRGTFGCAARWLRQEYWPAS
ncbi:hypothetical protein [Neoroseomonas oryzicola]|uniref:Uncharacterized protein n=1 Tax=Neoroseomonas oryzicola TaxID=535904 RepID=A0A9X9WJG5_9PROT|nr:hypothetical protein [Neoroseomonas oryzicola]MBR0660475.1 hypothetical protein [Neoroseomonas oryzicola]NKE18243.1 hypothetical protein [Neoroseomonas oryzicola]